MLWRISEKTQKINNNKEIICYYDNNYLTEHPYKNPEIKECYSSLNECFKKENIYFLIKNVIKIHVFIIQLF